MLWLYLLALGAAVVVAWKKPDLRKEMVFAGLLAVPVLLIEPLISGNYAVRTDWQALLTQRVVGSFALAALAAAGYKTLFHKQLSPVIHPQRRHLLVTVLGLVVFLVLFFTLHLPFAIALVISLGFDLVLLTVFWRGLVWDFLAAAIGMGLLYLLLFLSTDPSFMGGIENLWSAPTLSGLNLFALPVEVVAVVVGFGGLWGPLFSALREPGVEEEFQHVHLRPKRILVGGIIMLLALVIGWFSYFFILTPKVISAPVAGRVGLQSALVIKLDRPIDRQKIEVEIDPPVEGALSFQDSMLDRRFVQTIVFTPLSHFQPETQYALRVNNISAPFGDSETSLVHSFTTITVPKLTGASVVPGGEIGICDAITLNLDQANEGLVDFAASLNNLPLDLVLAKDKRSYEAKPQTCLAQGQDHTLVASRNLATELGGGEPIEQLRLTFKTKGAPGVSSLSPQGRNLREVKAISLQFTQPMLQKDPGELARITPELKGRWQWSDATKLEFIPQEKPAWATTYQVMVKKGLPAESGGFLTQDTQFNFSTLSAPSIIGLSPKNGSSNVIASTPIKVTFDQEVDKASAEKAFAIKPAIEGSFSWSGTTLIFSSKLAQNSSYQVVVSSGVTNGVGLSSVGSATTSFSTEDAVVLLNIPLDYQDKSLSCEVASLKMALNYRGAKVTEDMLMSHVGYDSTPHQGNIWGDPDVAFVGSITGKQNTTGYGVHAAPIAKAARHYRNAEAFTGWSVSDLTAQLAKGNPVVIWGIAGPSYYDPWVTPAGRTIKAWKGEHARVAIGFTGPVGNPTKIIINDPIFGRLYWSPSQFKSDWSAFGNMGVVVY